MSSDRCEELRIPLRHLHLAAKVWGDRTDPPILALHGWLDNAASFDRLAPLLKGRLVVALDLAGHGRSAHRPAGSWYPLVDNLDEIGQVIEWFGWPAVDLLGHSLGAALSSVYAALCPEKVGHLLLIEGLGPLTAAADKTLEQLRRSHAARAGFRGEKLRVFADIEAAAQARRGASDLSLEAARCLVQRGLTPAHELSAQQAKLAVDASMPGDGGSEDRSTQASSGFRWSSDPRLTLPSPTRLSEDQLAAILPGIRAQTLLVLAQPEVPYLSRELIEARIALVRSIEVVRLAGTHHLHLEDPAPVAAAINRFLASR